MQDFQEQENKHTAGSYISSKMVVLRNLRLPELDNNCNIDQQKALIFDAESCKYDVILGADFLSKTGIDVKYSTGTIEWFDNELTLRDTRTLQSRQNAEKLIIENHCQRRRQKHW